LMHVWPEKVARIGAGRGTTRARSPPVNEAIRETGPRAVG
jgi:hypothetical protein